MPHDDPSPETGPTQPGNARPDASVSRLFSSLQSRAGHAVVIGEDSAAAEALFERVDAQLVCQRRARLSGEGLDLDTMVQALGTDLRGPYCPQEPDAILSLVATEARAAGLPILVVITRAEAAGAATLQQLANLVDAVPDARAAVRFVLLGGPQLEAVLAQPEAQGLAACVVTTVRAPKREDARRVFPLQTPAAESPRRDTAQWIVAGLVALAGLIFFFAPWGGRDEPTRVASTPSAPVWPSDAPGTTVPAPRAAPPFPPMTVAPARPAAEPPPTATAAPQPPAAAPVPPVAASAPPVAPAPPAPPTETVAPLPPVEGTVTPVPSAEPEEYASAPADDTQHAEPGAGADAAPTPDRRAAVARERGGQAIAQSLQVGAFREIGNASALAQKLSADFPGVRIVTVERRGVRYHCVRLGGFADAYALAARANELRERGYATVRVEN